MKKSTSILLLTILLLQSGGMLIVFKVQQFAVQVEMQTALKDKHTRFDKISLSLSEFLKYKISRHEISIKGNIYDFKSSTIKGDKVELLVIHDIEEENILNEIKDYSTRTKHQNGELPNELQQLLSLYYLSPDAICLFVEPSLSLNDFSLAQSNLDSYDLEITTPPPKSC